MHQGIYHKGCRSIFNSHKQLTPSGQKGKEPSQGGTLEFTGQLYYKKSRQVIMKAMPQKIKENALIGKLID